MVSKLGMIAIAAAVLVQADASWALNCSTVDNTFPIYCRGKLYFELNAVFPPPANGLAQTPTEMLVTIPFTKSPKAAGAGGINLTPGTCGWVDRPLNSSEPASIQTWSDIGTSSKIGFEGVQSCIGNPSCIFGGCAENKGSYLQMYPWNIGVTNL